MSPEGSNWNEDEVILALDLYLDHRRILDGSHYEVQELIRLTGRTPGSVVRKLLNLQAIDKPGGGLDHYSATDKSVWNKFAGDKEKLREMADMIRQNLFTKSPKIEDEQVDADEKRILEGRIESTERMTRTRRRLYVAAMRRIALKNYSARCCFCGMDIPEFLEVAHIRSWSDDAKKRLSPSNVLCLCVLHHRAFDEGFLGISSDLSILVSSRLRRSSPGSRLADEVEGVHVQSAKKYAPDSEAIAYHLSNIFKP